MAQNMNPINVEDINEFDNKENSLHSSNVLQRSTEKGYEELDVSELNMKLRYSFTPASSPMSKSYTTNSENVNFVSDSTLCNENSTLTQSFNITATQETQVKSLKPLPLQTIPTEHFIDGNKQKCVLSSDATLSSTEIIVNVQNYSDENISLPSTSSSPLCTPEATTPNKEDSKPSGSPILRGIKNVLNMFRPSQSPIAPDENNSSKQILQKNPSAPELQSPTEQSDLQSRPLSVLSSTPISSQKRDKESKRESLVFNEDLEKELQWKDETTIIFSREKIPIHKLFLPQSNITNDMKIEHSSAGFNSAEEADFEHNKNYTLEPMEISYSDCLGTMEELKVTQVTETDKQDSIFMDCETTYVMNEDQVHELSNKTAKFTEKPEGSEINYAIRPHLQITAEVLDGCFNLEKTSETKVYVNDISFRENNVHSTSNVVVLQDSNLKDTVINVSCTGSLESNKYDSDVCKSEPALEEVQKSMNLIEVPNISKDICVTNQISQTDVLHKNNVDVRSLKSLSAQILQDKNKREIHIMKSKSFQIDANSDIGKCDEKNIPTYINSGRTDYVKHEEVYYIKPLVAIDTKNSICNKNTKIIDETENLLTPDTSLFQCMNERKTLEQENMDSVNQPNFNKIDINIDDNSKMTNVKNMELFEETKYIKDLPTSEETVINAIKCHEGSIISCSQFDFTNTDKVNTDQIKPIHINEIDNAENENSLGNISNEIAANKKLNVAVGSNDAESDISAAGAASIVDVNKQETVLEENICSVYDGNWKSKQQDEQIISQSYENCCGDNKLNFNRNSDIVEAQIADIVSNFGTQSGDGIVCTKSSCILEENVMHTTDNSNIITLNNILEIEDTKTKYPKYEDTEQNNSVEILNNTENTINCTQFKYDGINQSTNKSCDTNIVQHKVNALSSDQKTEDDRINQNNTTECQNTQNSNVMEEPFSEVVGSTSNSVNKQSLVLDNEFNNGKKNCELEYSMHSDRPSVQCQTKNKNIHSGYEGEEMPIIKDLNIDNNNLIKTTLGGINNLNNADEEIILSENNSPYVSLTSQPESTITNECFDNTTNTLTFKYAKNNTPISHKKSIETGEKQCDTRSEINVTSSLDTLHTYSTNISESVDQSSGNIKDEIMSTEAFKSASQDNSQSVSESDNVESEVDVPSSNNKFNSINNVKPVNKDNALCVADKKLNSNKSTIEMNKNSSDKGKAGSSPKKPSYFLVGPSNDDFVGENYCNIATQQAIIETFATENKDWQSQSPNGESSTLKTKTVASSDTTFTCVNKSDEDENTELVNIITTENSKSIEEEDITVIETHTDDEDTIEGPFIEAEFNSDSQNIIDFNCERVEGNELNNIQKQCTDDEEMFIDADTFEFLMNQNKSTEVTDSGKESLFLKFDPLFAKRVNSDGVVDVLSKLQKRQSTPKKLRMHKKDFNVMDLFLTAGPSNPSDDVSCSNENVSEDVNLTSQKPTLVVQPAINPVVTPRKLPLTPTRSNRLSMTFSSPAMAVIDKLLSLSGNSSLLGNDTTLTHVNTEQNEAERALVQLRELLAEKEISLQQLRCESQELKDKLVTVESHMLKLESECQKRLQNINELNEKLVKKDKMNKNMSSVVEEYEKTIAELVAGLEEDKRRHADERMQLTKERDDQTAHLASMEAAFSDLHSKYEKSKQVILSYRANEVIFKKSIEEFNDNLLKMQNNYEQLKQHATSKLNHANQELEKINKGHQAEVLKLNAMIKRKDLHISSLEETLAQKTKANEELTAICDELINKVG